MQRKCGECRWWELREIGATAGDCNRNAVRDRTLHDDDPGCVHFSPISVGTCADCRWFTPGVCHIDPLSRQVIPAHWCARFDLR